LQTKREKQEERLFWGTIHRLKCAAAKQSAHPRGINQTSEQSAGPCIVPAMAANSFVRTIRKNDTMDLLNIQWVFLINQANFKNCRFEI
jgi:hypothetical protein